MLDLAASPLSVSRSRFLFGFGQGDVGLISRRRVAGCARTVVGAVIACLSIVAGRGLSLAQGLVVLNEIVAENDRGLVDEDRDAEDWIELRSLGGAVDLEGWFLTDDPGNLTRWRFPAVWIPQGGYLVVFASGKNRAPDDGELHADFRLDGTGEFLALVRPDGMTIEDSFAPRFPRQRADVSWGRADGFTGSTELIPAVGASARVLVPISAESGVAWILPDFDDSTWREEFLGVGYDASAGLLPPDGETENIAPTGVASQSSIFAPALGPENGNDGDLSNFTATASDDTSPEWRLDLGSPRAIASITVHNRGDGCCQSRLRDITVEILDDDAETVYETELLNPENALGGGGLGGPATLAVDVVERAGAPATGRYVIVRRTPDPDLSGTGGAGNADEPNVLSVGEVEVFAPASNAYSAFIRTDLEDEMRGVGSSAYVRVPFAVSDSPLFEVLHLRMRYDDGFVAYLNGVEVARRNVPGPPDAPVPWDARATLDRGGAAGAIAEEIDLSPYLGAIVPGNNVLAVHGLNSARDDEDFLIAPELFAAAFAGAAGFAYFERPTPNAPNEGSAYAGLVADTRFSVERGYFSSPFEVEISTETEGAEIRFTLDGSAPSATRGSIYSGPVSIDQTTILRAAAFRDGFLPTNVDTQSYVFPADVVDQPVMVRAITGHATYGPLLEEALTAIPSLSIVTAAAIPSTSEVLASIEFLRGDGREGFHTTAGIKRVGGHSLGAYPKNNMRIYFRREYGPAKLDYPLFEDVLYGDRSVESFDRLTLRSGSHDSVFYLGDGQQPPSDAQYLRNRFMNDVQFEMGHLSLNGRWAHVYLNGTYWGHYQILERPAPGHMAEYLGGEKEEFEAVNRNSPVGGAAPAWSRIRSIRASYDEILRYVDVTNLVDYMILNYWAGNAWDWRPDQNWMAGGPSLPDRGGYKFYCWDSDIVLRRTEDNNIGIGGPDNLFRDLLRHADFKVLVADRIWKHCFEDGVLTPARITAIYDRRAAEIETSIVAETARWQWRRTWTRDVQWAREKDRLERDFFPRRMPILLAQFGSQGWISDLTPPEISKRGGSIARGETVILRAAQGEILYTLDGSDPRLPGGAVSPGARHLGEGGEPLERTLVPSEAAVRFLVPADEALGLDWIDPNFDDSSWSLGETAVGFDRSDSFDALLRSDVEAEMYLQQTSVYLRVEFEVEDEAEFATWFLSLLMKYDDGFVAYLNGIEIASKNAPADPVWNSRATSGHADSDALEFEVFDITEHAALLRRGENVLAIHGLNLTENSGDVLFLPEIRASRPSSGLVRLDRSGFLKARTLSGGSWSPLREAEFAVDSSGFRLTELMYHPAAAIVDERYEADDFEFIELANAGRYRLNLGGVRVSGGVEFTFPESGDPEDDLAPGGIVLLVKNAAAFATRYGTDGLDVRGEYRGNLSNAGETVSLVDRLGATLAELSYRDTWQPLTDGEGYSLEVVDVYRDPSSWSEPASWRSSAQIFGSPGQHDFGGGEGGLQRIGDINQDGRLDISDPIFTLRVLFAGGVADLPCGEDVTAPGNRRLLDGNDDGSVNITDAIYLLEYLFRAGPEPVGGTECVRISGCRNACVE